jgi:hypothetical protein
MEDNVLVNVSQTLPFIVDDELILSVLNEIFTHVDKVYSYIIYAHYDENDLITKWTIRYAISEKSSYNTLDSTDCVSEIYSILTKKQDKRRKIIGYKQPCIEIMLEVFDPLVNKLAKLQFDRWKQYTHEDLCQMCRLVMIKLYRKGYYIHKVLLQKAFNNYILVSLRPERNAPVIVSFEDTFYKSMKSDSETILFADTIADTSIEEEQENTRITEAEAAIFEEVKNIVIELVGERQWRELVRDYSNKHTSTRTRKLMNKVKTHFNTLGLSRKDFNNKYYG